MPKPIQLGTVSLYTASPSSLSSPSSPSSAWLPTDESFLNHTSWHPDSEPTAILLAQCLHDSCLGASIARYNDGDKVLVRVSVTPNDDRSWRRSHERVKRLKTLFPLLERGWDAERRGEGGKLLQVPVSFALLVI